MAVIFGSLIALPLAFFTVKYDFRGKILIQSLGILPLVMPPFVGAIAMQLVLGRSGVINLLLLRWFGTTVPFMEGLRGVIIVQTLHYFPFILLNASASLKNVDPSLEEMAQNMGAHGLRLFRRITLPLMMPGLKKQPFHPPLRLRPKAPQSPNNGKAGFSSWRTGSVCWKT